MNFNEYFQWLKTTSKGSLVPEIVFNDGFTASIQASRSHYCSPRTDDAKAYESFEIGFPSEQDVVIHSYAEDRSNPTNTVYGWVPVEVIETLIEKHGGIKEPKCTA